MNTKIWDVRGYIDNLASFPEIDDIKQIYHQGGLIALPTETVYGLGANALDSTAIKKIYQAKGRPSDNPLIVHIHSLEQLADFTSGITDEVKLLMKHFWPGPISFILPLRAGYLCSQVTGGLDSIAVRMPSHRIGRQILQLVDLPIAAPSANLSGKPSPTQFDHVYQDLNGRIDGIINGDQSEEGLESTVLDCTSFPFKIARPGSITQKMIEAVIPNSIAETTHFDKDKPIAPGMKYKHYAPQTPIYLLQNFQHQPSYDKSWEHHAFIVPATLKSYVPSDAQYIELCNDEQDIKTANHRLYEILHLLDRTDDIEEAYMYAFEELDDTAAIMNRMLKATNQLWIDGDTL